MAQYGVLMYIYDSAHALDATPEDTEPCDEHSDDLVESGVQLAAYALTPRDMATSIRADGVTSGPFLNSEVVVVGGVEVRPIHSSYVAPGHRSYVANLDQAIA